MITLIDNYDSFTYNLVHYFGELGAAVVVHRNDQIGVGQVLGSNPEAIVISPGPCDPDQAGICLELIAAAGTRFPILGVCLGHQALGQAYGGNVIRAPTPMHGKVSLIRHDGSGIFKDLPSPFEATRYHSLILDRASVPADFAISAETEDGLVMGIAHKHAPLFGVQFHPESIATAHGHRLLENFLTVAGVRRKVAA